MLHTVVRDSAEGHARAPEGTQKRRPRSRLARSWSWTPGRLSLIMAGLLLLVVALGVVAAATVQSRSDATVALVEAHEPTSADIQRLYRALSDADATAASAFLAAGSEPEQLRKRYDDDIAIAGPTPGLAAVDRARDPRVAEEIGVIGRQVPIYAGLVETARVYNQQGLPVGAAYLREASQLMRAEILPAAERLYRIQNERVIAARDSATGFPVLAVGLTLATLLALFGAQYYIWRVSGRRLNLGLLVATGAVVIGTVWGAAALVTHASLAESGHHSERVAVLSDARITALQARANELLTLVARGNSASYAEEFEAMSRRLQGSGGKGGALHDAADGADSSVAVHVDKASDAAQTWLKSYQEVRELDDNGNYDDAVKLAIDTEQSGSSAPAFSALDRSLGRAIDAGRQLFVNDTMGAAGALTFLTIGWVVLAIIAAFGVVFGVWQRLREYR